MPNLLYASSEDRCFIHNLDTSETTITDLDSALVDYTGVLGINRELYERVGDHILASWPHHPIEITDQAYEQADESAKKALNKAYRTQGLRNCLRFIENFKSRTDDLRKLWKEDWHGFHEEFWALLKTHLNGCEMTMIVPDLIEKDEGKPELNVLTISGEKSPEFTPALSEHSTLYDSHRRFFGPPLNIVEKQSGSGHVCFTFTIKDVSSIVAGRFIETSAIQWSTLTGILNALQ